MSPSISAESSEKMNTASEASSPGVTEKGIQRPVRVRAEPHGCSGSDHRNQVHLQQNKGQTTLFKGNEARILALDMRQIESREIANRKKKGKARHCFAQAHSLKVRLTKGWKKGQDGAQKEVK